MLRTLSKSALVAVAALSLVGQAARGQSGGQCEAPELVASHEEYSRLVCEGLQAFERGRFSDAASHFTHALDLRLAEVPNFQLFGRLSLAQWKAGQRNAGRENLEKARLALSVLVGIYRCRERGPGFTLVDDLGQAVDSPHVQEIAGRMCGAAYEYMYDRSSLDAFVADAELVKVFLGARDVIHKR